MKKKWLLITFFIILISVCIIPIIKLEKVNKMQNEVIEKKTTLPDDIYFVNDIYINGNNNWKIIGNEENNKVGAIWNTSDAGKSWNKELIYSELLPNDLLNDDYEISGYLDDQDNVFCAVYNYTKNISKYYIITNEECKEVKIDVDEFDMEYVEHGVDYPNAIIGVKYSNNGYWICEDYMNNYYIIDCNTYTLINKIHTEKTVVDDFFTYNNVLYLVSSNGIIAYDMLTSKEAELTKNLDLFNQDIKNNYNYESDRERIFYSKNKVYLLNNTGFVIYSNFTKKSLSILSSEIISNLDISFNYLKQINEKQFLLASYDMQSEKGYLFLYDFPNEK